MCDMKFGCCADIDKAPILHEAGYDFIECTVISLKPEEDEAAFKQVLAKYEQSPLPVETCNILLPGDMKIVGNDVHQGRVKNYLSLALERVKRIGADTVVFGSGGARTFPQGFSREKGEEQILEFLQLVADVADPLDLTIVIEPLNKEESNIVNSVPEAVAFAKRVNRRSVKVLADFYHMEEEREPLENISKYGEYIKHIHVADTGRLAPGTGDYPYETFMDHIKQSDYHDRISIECGWNHFEKEVTSALSFLKRF